MNATVLPFPPPERRYRLVLPEGMDSLAKVSMLTEREIKKLCFAVLDAQAEAITQRTGR